MNVTPGPYRFHAFDVPYFSAKVRPALRYKPRHRLCKRNFKLEFESNQDQGGE